MQLPTKDRVWLVPEGTAAIGPASPRVGRGTRQRGLSAANAQRRGVFVILAARGRGREGVSLEAVANWVIEIIREQLATKLGTM